MKWKPDWEQTKEHFVKWWDRKGLLAQVFAPADKPVADIAKPAEPADMLVRWLDPKYRRAKAEYEMSRTFYGGDAFPYFDTYTGPGGLGTFLGANPNFVAETVWYNPCIADPDTFGPINFDPGAKWFKAQMAIIEEGVRNAAGRYLVGVPDLIEGMDTLAAMRDTEPLLVDCIERPSWVRQRLEEITQAYFDAFDAIFAKVKDADGGNAFSAFQIWGPGRTAKLQCDICCMLSPAMFAKFVAPFLKAQCDWLDYSMFHFDGTTAMQHLDALLAVDSLDAIQWTPQAGKPSPGNREWFGLYKRIRAGGKGVQAHSVKLEEIRPLLDAVGPEGMFITVRAKDQREAEKALEIIARYR
ncbi:MAG: hypothetical protein ACE15C_01705 [Phycisphaerae bacterium]